MASKLTEKQRAELKELFQYLDKDNSKTISKDEFRVALKLIKQQPSDKEFDTLLRRVDKNGDSSVDFEEFLDLMAPSMAHADVAESKRIRDAFRVFDINNDGKLTHEEIRQVMKNLGVTASDQEIDEMIKTVDNDNEGVISFEEFISLMRRY